VLADPKVRTRDTGGKTDCKDMTDAILVAL
jgi:isocitrate/isopropylmalate dehydrogenase